MKHMLRIFIISLTMAAGISLASCQDGIFEGIGGGGNLVITGLSGYKGMYIGVTGTVGGVSIGFKSSTNGNDVVQISGGSVSAPVYNQTNFYKYTADSNGTITITIYKEDAKTTIVETKSVTVKFYSGGAWL